LKSNPRKKVVISRRQAEAFDPEDGSIAFLRNFGGLIPNYSSTLKIEAIRSSETSVDSYQSRRSYSFLYHEVSVLNLVEFISDYVPVYSVKSGQFRGVTAILCLVWYLQL
jgi:hypothetical protein